MIVGPPAPPTTSSTWPRGSSTIVGVIAESMRLPGAIAFCSPCTSPNMFGCARLRGEVVHLVVEEEPGAAHPDRRAEAVVQRRRRRHGVALCVDDRVVRRVLRLAAGDDRRRRRVALIVDLRAQLARVLFARQLRLRHVRRTPDRRACCCGRGTRAGTTRRGGAPTACCRTARACRTSRECSASPSS